jgi:hypothetical protein
VKKTADLITQLRQRLIIGQHQRPFHGRELYRIEIKFITHRTTIYMLLETAATNPFFRSGTGHRGSPPFRILSPSILEMNNGSRASPPGRTGNDARPPCITDEETP